MSLSCKAGVAEVTKGFFNRLDNQFSMPTGHFPGWGLAIKTIASGHYFRLAKEARGETVTKKNKIYKRNIPGH